MGIFDVIVVEPPINLGDGVEVSEFQTKWTIVIFRKQSGVSVAAYAYASIIRGTRTYYVDLYVALEPKGEKALLPRYDNCSLTTYRIGDEVDGVILLGIEKYGIADLADDSFSIPPSKLEGLKYEVDKWRNLETGEIESETVRIETSLGTLFLTRRLKKGEKDYSHLRFRFKGLVEKIQVADAILEITLKKLGLIRQE